MSMREIKFRAWDDKKKEWLLGYELPALGGFSMFGECMLFGEWTNVLNSRPLMELDTIKLMQYTGLKDKNGKEIYEGDIIKHLDRIENKEKIDKIDWLENTGAFGGFYGNGTDEIIGNIYENPELLK